MIDGDAAIGPISPVEVPDGQWCCVVRRVDGQPRLVEVIVQFLQLHEFDCCVGIGLDLMKKREGKNLKSKKKKFKLTSSPSFWGQY